jgi:hypothetical protein
MKKQIQNQHLPLLLVLLLSAKSQKNLIKDSIAAPLLYMHKTISDRWSEKLFFSFSFFLFHPTAACSKTQPAALKDNPFFIQPHSSLKYQTPAIFENLTHNLYFNMAPANGGQDNYSTHFF